MKKFFTDPRVQKCFLPLSFVCIFPIWLMLMRKTEHIPAAVYILLVPAVIFLCLDRIFKPWDKERASQMRKPKPEERRADSVTAGKTDAETEDAGSGIQSDAETGEEIVRYESAADRSER